MTLQEALALVRSNGGTVTFEAAASPPPEEVSPERAQKVRTKSVRSAEQPKFKKCGNCGEIGHNARTCNKRAAIDVTTALLDGVIPEPVGSEVVPSFLDSIDLSFL